MSTKRPPSAIPPRPDWTVTTEGARIAGHKATLSPGVELTVQDGRRRRRMSFRRLVTTEAGSAWVDAWDGRLVRSVELGRIITVHRTRKMAGRG